MIEKLTNVEAFATAFQLKSCSRYVDYTPFSNDIGFSVQRPYPQDCRYKPPRLKDGTPDSVALIAIRYEPERREPKNPNVIPITVRVGAYSRYMAGHMDYQFDDPECPTEDSILVSNKTPKPVTLTATDKYFYDHERDTLITSDGHEIQGIDVLNEMYDSNVATVDRMKGLILQWKLRSQNRTAAMCDSIRKLLEWLLNSMCGRKLEPRDITHGIWGEYQPEDVKFLKTEKMDIFGYSASKRVIVSFCILVLLGYSILHWCQYTSPWLQGIFSINLLIIAFSIVAIALLDHALPKLLLRTINLMIRLRFKIMTATFKFV